MAHQLRYRILGPVDVEGPDGPMPVGGRHARALLLALLLDLNHAVSVDRLAQAVWADAPPPSADRTLRSYVSRLRHLLGSETIVAVDHSYCLLAEAGQVDAIEFEGAVNAAAETLATDPVRAERLCRQALGMWRGDPFGDLAEADFARLEATRLEEVRERAVELCLEAELAQGRAGEVVGRLEAETEAFPYRERMWWCLVKALSDEGRRVEALRAYDRAISLLAEVGVEPGEDLRALALEVAGRHPAGEAAK